MTVLESHSSFAESPFLLKRQTYETPQAEAYGTLAVGYRGYEISRAADPGFPANFLRDGLVGAALRGSQRAMEGQIAFSAAHIGKKQDPFSGEEPGKPAHEILPSVVQQAVIYNGMSTAYNACDTGGLWLNGVSVLAEIGNTNVLDIYRDQIQEVTGYILRHITKDGLFVEDPAYSGADRYGVQVTYWKDSILNNKTRTTPDYPVVYTQPHFLNAQALARIGKLTGDAALLAASDKMYEAGIATLWAGDHFVTAIDSQGVIDPPSSDSMLSLLHIPKTKLPVGYAARIEGYMEQLETESGYRTGLPVATRDDVYHTKWVWQHEQPLLHAAARGHNLKHAQEVAKRIVPYMAADAEQGIFAELRDPETQEWEGNPIQYWAIAGYQYFQNPYKSLF